MSKTRRNLLGRDPSGTHPCCLGLFAGRGAHSAGACCALCVEAELRHCDQPGQHARTYPLNRQGTAAAAYPHACFSKGCSSTASRVPLQRLWGSKAHTYRLARTYAHTHAHIHIHTRRHTHTHIQTQTCANIHRLAHAQTHRHTQAYTY